MNKENITNVSTLSTALVTALLPLACCWGPTLLAGIAVLSGVASEMAWLHPYEPYLYAVSFTTLGFSHYKIYKKGKTNRDECQSCAADDNGMTAAEKYTKVVLWVATGLILIMFLVNQFPVLFI